MGLKNQFIFLIWQHPHYQFITEIRTLLSNKQENYKQLIMTCKSDFDCFFQPSS